MYTLGHEKEKEIKSYKNNEEILQNDINDCKEKLVNQAQIHKNEIHERTLEVKKMSDEIKAIENKHKLAIDDYEDQISGLQASLNRQISEGTLIICFISLTE